ncbi:hypothetical protein EVA_15062 [gut metagenome]|uniref:Uncharacterized protein n=1 Tax=gut metagenome TaxID=749906 RepID=J9CA75_9ZZZZ
MSQKLPLNIKQTGSIFIAGNAGMTAPLNLSVTVPADPTTIPTSIPRKRSNSSTTCAGAIQMPVWSFSGSNSCSADIPAPFPVYTGFCAGRA